MAETSGISWTDATFNPVVGCTKVSAGCAHCYAERDFDKRRGFAKWGPHGTRVLTSAANWLKPVRWNEKQLDYKADNAKYRIIDANPFRVFTGSLCDVMETWDGPITNRSGEVVFFCPNGCIDGASASLSIESFVCLFCGSRMLPMTYDDVRKRLFKLISETNALTWLMLTKRIFNVPKYWPKREDGSPVKFGNVQLGTSIENQETLGRAGYLINCTPYAERLFVSAEPLLGPLTLGYWAKSRAIDWVIVGAESGPDRRPMELSWARSLRDECLENGIAFFMKQLAIDGQVTADVNKFPKDLRIQQFPGGR